MIASEVSKSKNKMWGFYVLIASITCCIPTAFCCLSSEKMEKMEDPVLHGEEWRPKFSSTHVEQRLSPIANEETDRQEISSENEIEVKISNPTPPSSPTPLSPVPHSSPVRRNRTDINWTPVFDEDDDYEYLI